MGDGVKDAELKRKRFPQTKTCAWEVDEGELFIWSQNMYRVVCHAEDNVIVVCIARLTADHRWQVVRGGVGDENFNPCAYVITDFNPVKEEDQCKS